MGQTLETQLGVLPLPQALYLLLVTNKASNILEDLETLRLLAKVVPEYIDSLDEEVRGPPAAAPMAGMCDPLLPLLPAAGRGAQLLQPSIFELQNSRTFRDLSGLQFRVCWTGR